MNRTPYLQLTWYDEQTDAQGYLVIDRLLRGVASGGLRMRPGCTLSEVTDLARTMTLKESLVHQPGDRYLPFGGAKGGIDFDPSSPEAPGVLTRFLGAVSPLVETYWAVGEDLGTRQEDIDAAVTAAGLRSCVHPALRHVPDGAEAGLRRIDHAFAIRIDGLGLGDTVGGYGVAQAVLATLAETDENPVGLTAVVQGFGSMGGAAARYLARAGMRVVAVVDQDGVVADPDGLDVETLLARRSSAGLVDRDRLPPGARLLPGDEWLSVASDVLVTAAASYAVDDANEDEVRCGYLVEAANVSVLPSAERALLKRGVIVVPDFLANFAANSWWWWTLFGDVDADAGEALAKIDKTMWRLVEDVFAEVRATGLSPRAVASRLAERNHAHVHHLSG
ncbi:Glu/Leu/Phe/Val dehydrogenase dimerization domain-containing protein [Streptomyces sp. CRN 30]|uniref:Glu/Leu/Phe/Val dehydrogenase dimerization domain-containing protein n=1 Tax=Streptomyces sp. CRN 30 TaxID=3075613 RepID=UPI002A8311A4|nr:Glu/Leu/Phe/Val dehydrogenase dimerization domain-containing protein [Streptomyces sp. CRN 30]